MASTKTLSSLSDRWPDGTALSIYPRSNFNSANPPTPGVAPVGSAVGSAQTLTNGSVTFSGLSSGTEYVVTDAAGSKYVRTRVDASSSNSTAANVAVTASPANNGVQLQAAVDSAQPDNGAVSIPGSSGNNIIDREITYDPTKALRFHGTGRNATILQWSTDLGAGKYAIRPAAGAQDNKVWHEFGNVQLVGPSNAGGLGTLPASMHGIKLASYTVATDMIATGFNGGLVINGDHQKVYRTKSYGNYYNVYYEPGAATWGDQGFFACNFEGPRFASIACAGTNSITWVTFQDVHMGFGPYGIVRETGAAQAFLTNCAFHHCGFESVGNAGIFCVDKNITLDLLLYNKFTDVALSWDTANWKLNTTATATGDTNATTTLSNVSVSAGTLAVGMTVTGTNLAAGTTIKAINGSTVTLSQAATGTTVGGAVNAAWSQDWAIDVGGIRDCTFDGNIGMLEAAGNVAVLRCSNNLVGNEIFGVNNLVANVVSSGKPFADTPTTVDNNNLYGRGYRAIIGVSTGAIAQNALVQQGGLANQITSATTGVPLGVALHAASGGSVRTIYAVQGRVSIKQTTAVAQGNYVKADTVNSGNVTPEATPATKTSLTVGVAKSASSGGLVDTQLMQLA